MQADLSQDLSYLTTTKRDALWNRLPVSYQYFAEFTNLYERAYGVLNGQEHGLTGPENEVLESFVVNRCLRRSLVRALVRVAQETEKRIGYKLTPRYLRHKIVWNGSHLIQLQFPGVESVEVEENWYTLSETIDFSSYYMAEAVELVQDGTELLARVPEELFGNPSWAVLYDETKTKRLEVNKSHSRYAEHDGTGWLLPISLNLSNADPSDTVHAYHRELIRIRVAKPDISAYTAGGNYYPVYPGTFQIVPHQTQFNKTGYIDYIFPVYALINPAFQDETIDWRRFETYKLLRQLEFAYRVEEPAYLTVTWTQGDDVTTYQYDPSLPATTAQSRLLAQIVDADTSIISLYENDTLFNNLHNLWTTVCSDSKAKMPKKIHLEIPYKVNPSLVASRYQAQIQSLQEAIIHRIAAELPMADCGCQTKVGFIFEQQRKFGDVYFSAYTGVEVTKTNFNERHGQLVYANILKESSIYRPRLVAGKTI